MSRPGRGGERTKRHVDPAAGVGEPRWSIVVKVLSVAAKCNANRRLGEL